MGCFKEDNRVVLRSQPLQQIWRDHLLAGAHLHVDKLNDGFFVFLYPESNPHCVNAVKEYRECLTDHDTFVLWTLEDVVNSIKRRSHGDWIDRFIDRYLDFGKLTVAS